MARGAAALALAVLALAAAGTPGVAAPAAAAAALAAPAADGKVVKYYIVTQLPDGKPEFLFSIAEKTLGNGDRFPEIFALNKGRRQPDGSVMDDPTVIASGWVLQLPQDAKGDGVRTGALPEFPPAGAEAPGAGQASAPALPQSQGLVPPPATGQTSWLGPGLGAGAAVLVAGALASVVIRRRRAVAGPVELPVAAFAPRTGAPARSRTAAVPTAVPAASAASRARFGPRPEPVPASGAGAGAAVPAKESEPAAASGRTETAVRAAVPITPRRAATATPAATAGATAAGARRQAGAARPAPSGGAATGPEAGPAYQVSYGDDVIDVHIDTEAAAAWHPVPYETPEGGAAFLCIGVSEGDGCLFLDFAQAPGAIAVKGDLEAGRRLVESLVLQLGTSPVREQAGVVVVGRLAELAEGVDGVDAVGSLDELARRRAEEAGAPFEFVFCEVASAAEVSQIAALLKSPGRVVPVVLGKVAGTSWRLEARAGEPEE
ncbi:hypothetical protein [Streptomyces sp. NPDC000410]|uniref:hypothetical protein n=1 Tax=Streptomyces sp. NPDC000410 TaxID=3154254 RepID=UPI00332FB3FB